MNRRFFAPANKRRIPGSFNRAGALLVLSLVAFATFVGVFSAIRPTPTSAAASTTLTFQARLLNTGGSLVPDGTYNVEFKIYDTVASGASAQGVCSLNSSTDDCWWLETRTGANKVTVKNGYVYANLGSVTAFSSTIPWDQELWITMNIGGTGAPSWDGEMSPRFKVAAVPYAFAAAKLQVTDSAITNKLIFATPSASNKTITLPNETGTVCTTGSICSGYQASVTGGAANQQLSNLSGTVAINQSLLPGANDTIDLGSDALRFRDLYLGGETLHIGTSTSDEGTIAYTTSSNTLSLQSTGAISLASNTSVTGTLAVSGASITVGTASTTNGTVKLLNSTNAFGITIVASAQTVGDGTISFPNTSGAADTFCLVTIANCAGSGSTLQGTYDTDANGSDSIITLTSADDSLIFRNPSSSGSDSGFVLTVDQLNTGAVGGLYVSSVGTGALLKVTDATATSRDVLTVADGGATTFRNQTDSTAAFQIQNAAGTSNLLVADTTNTKIGIATAPSSTGATLQVVGNVSATTGVVLAATGNSSSTVTKSTVVSTAVTINDVVVIDTSNAGQVKTTNIGGST